MKPGCIGKSNTDFFNDATQKSARVVQLGIAIEFVPREPIFEKCPHLREKGGGADQNLGSFGIGCPVQ
jgi:hypothetical protein